MWNVEHLRKHGGPHHDACLQDVLPYRAFLSTIMGASRSQLYINKSIHGKGQKSTTLLLSLILHSVYPAIATSELPVFRFKPHRSIAVQNCHPWERYSGSHSLTPT
jgi:hypothetical protein